MNGEQERGCDAGKQGEKGVAPLLLEPSEEGDLLRIEHRKLMSWPAEALAGAPAVCAGARAFSAQFNFIRALPVRALEPLAPLTHLALGGNELTAIPDLSCLPGLRRLHLNNNKIRCITGLDCVPALEVLDLRGNHVARLQGLAGLSQLRRLSLACNAIAEIDPQGVPTTWPRLEFLSLYGNRVAHTAQLVDLVLRAPALCRLLLGGNPGWPPVRSQDDSGTAAPPGGGGSVGLGSGDPLEVLASLAPLPASLEWLDGEYRFARL